MVLLGVKWVSGRQWRVGLCLHFYAGPCVSYDSVGKVKPCKNCMCVFMVCVSHSTARQRARVRQTRLYLGNAQEQMLQSRGT